jgi:hypothetical protein
MTILNIETLRSGINTHKNYEHTPKGYVAIGKGGHGKNELHSYYNIPQSELSCHIGNHAGSSLEFGKVGNEPTAMYYVKQAFYEEHIKEKFTMLELMAKAEGLIGKTVLGSKFNRTFAVEGIRMLNSKFGVPTWLAPADNDYLKKHGFLIIVECAADYANVATCEVIDNIINLNGEYDAVIEGKFVKVGCQTIPIEKVQEILDTYKKLNP